MTRPRQHAPHFIHNTHLPRPIDLTLHMALHHTSAHITSPNPPHLPHLSPAEGGHESSSPIPSSLARAQNKSLIDIRQSSTLSVLWHPSTHKLTCFWLLACSYSHSFSSFFVFLPPFFGQRPRRGPEGTLVLCTRGNFVRTSVRPYVCTSVPPSAWV